MVKIQEGQMRRQWLRLPQSHQPGWREVLLAAATFGAVLFLGLVIP